jgi:hypothetical protein
VNIYNVTHGETDTDTTRIEAKVNSEPVADAGSNKEAVIRYFRW